MPLKISVVVCTHNRCDDLMRTLDSLASQDYPKSDYEVIVVDNRSTDRTKDVVDEFIRKYPPMPPLEKRGGFSIASPLNNKGGIRKADDAVKVRYIFEEKIGLSHARNRGIAESCGDVIAFIDDDASAEKTWLSELSKVYSEEKDAGCVGGRVLLDWRVVKPGWWQTELDEVFNGINYSNSRICLSYPRYPYGTNISFRKDVLSKVGMFRTDLGRIGRKLLAGEETEMCLRIEKSGFKIFYEPMAIVYHEAAPQKLSKSYIRHRSFWHGKSLALFELQHFGSKHVAIKTAERFKYFCKWAVKLHYPLVEQKSSIFFLGYFYEGMFLIIKSKLFGQSCPKSQ